MRTAPGLGKKKDTDSCFPTKLLLQDSRFLNQKAGLGSCLGGSVVIPNGCLEPFLGMQQELNPVYLLTGGGEGKWSCCRTPDNDLSRILSHWVPSDLMAFKFNVNFSHTFKFQHTQGCSIVEYIWRKKNWFEIQVTHRTHREDNGSRPILMGQKEWSWADCRRGRNLEHLWGNKERSLRCLWFQSAGTC